jgi:LUC7 N_terminus
MKEITELSTKISFSLDEIDVLGSQKQVAMALQQFHQVDLLQHEKKEKEVNPCPRIFIANLSQRELRTNHDPSGSQSKLQVCDVCGAYLSRLDNDRRLADHFAGKVELPLPGPPEQCSNYRCIWVSRRCERN